MTQRCECEHWQQCPTCTPDGFDAAGNCKPPEPTARQACSAELDEWRKLRDPETLHANLLRGQPARLSVACGRAGLELPRGRPRKAPAGERKKPLDFNASLSDN